MTKKIVKKVKIITAAMLKRKRPCQPAFEYFKERFPNGFEVTRSNIRKLTSEDRYYLGISWFMGRFTTVAAYNAYQYGAAYGNADLIEAAEIMGWI